MNKKILLILLTVVFSFFLHADDYLYGEFIYNLNLDLVNNPFPGISTDGFEGVVPDEYEKEIISRLLEEARQLFSGMIYGYTVVYTPSDKSRSVERFYQINPIAEIQSGDPRLESYDMFLEDNIYHLFLRYRLDPHQQRKIEYWNSGVFDAVSSYGRYPLYGEDSRINSVYDGIRLSLENLLKPEEFNKPSSIEAEVSLRSIPFMSIDSGQNRAFVKLRVDIKKVRHYLGNN